MITVVWLLPAASPTHYDLIGEALESLLSLLSTRLPLWGISWNPLLPGPTYTLSLWNGKGRLIGFQGKWTLSRLAEEVEELWQMEDFRPKIILGGTLSWMKTLTRRWQRRFSRLLSFSFPLPAPSPIYFPSTGLGILEEWRVKRSVCLFVQRDGAAQAAYIADLLGLDKYTVFVVGTPREVTALRSAASRFPSRIHLRIGLPWIETELYALRSEVLISVGYPFNEEPLFRIGRPWVTPSQHPFAQYAKATYRKAEDLLSLLPHLSASEEELSPQEFVRAIESYLSKVCE
ncbi:MAG: hypothetical protein RMK19_05935 [Bacteroidia bacterium]|nr:hypothetical protein [Bacteroidia bacterium]MDW8015532.1 hypothetical protein [Bacteroidia bacterium]